MSTCMAPQALVIIGVSKHPTTPYHDLSVSEPLVILSQAFGEQFHMMRGVNGPKIMGLSAEIFVAEFRHNKTLALGDVCPLEAPYSD